MERLGLVIRLIQLGIIIAGGLLQTHLIETYGQETANKILTGHILTIGALFLILFTNQNQVPGLGRE